MDAPKTLIVLTAVTLLIISGCSGIRVGQDYSPDVSFSGYRTYDWDPSVQEIPDRTKVESPLVLERIKNAIEQNLAEKGWTQNSTSPDCLLAYSYIVESKLSSTRSSPRVGIIMGGMMGKSARGSVSVGTGYDIEQHDQGQVLVDILDVKTGKLLWRGSGTFREEYISEPEKMTKKINETVRKILNQFPPK